MGETSAIGWTDGTFNLWWGCVEVSPACDNCYARTFAARTGFKDIWGVDGPRRFFGEKHWHEPLKWNRKAEAAGKRKRVFVQSMADIGEVRHDAVGQQMDEARERFFGDIVPATPWIDWLLLTKRGQFYRSVPRAILDRPNVWPGVTVEANAYRSRLVPICARGAAGPIWVSYEPGLEYIDFRPLAKLGLRWVVMGGDNAPRAKARPFDVRWPRQMIRDCREVGMAPFVKQLGSRPGYPAADGPQLPGLNCEALVDDFGDGWCRYGLRDSAGADPAEWTEDLRVQEFPRAQE